jgi:hypothetical protein
MSDQQTYDYRHRCTEHWPKPRRDEKTGLMVPTDAGFIHAEPKWCAQCLLDSSKRTDTDYTKLAAEARGYTLFHPSHGNPIDGTKLADAIDALVAERDEAQRRYKDEYNIVDRVWAALGLKGYDECKPYSIDEHVTRLRDAHARLEKENRIRKAGLEISERCIARYRALMAVIMEYGLPADLRKRANELGVWDWGSEEAIEELARAALAQSKQEPTK